MGRTPRTRGGELHPWASAAALVPGALLVAGGVGVGLPHQTKAGWTWAAVAGLACLVVGLLLVVAAAAGLARPVGRWLRVAVVAGVTVVVLLVVYLVAIPLAATVVPPIRPDGRTPAAVGLDYSDVVLPTDDGARLAAWYVPSTNGAAVVLLHGSGSTRATTLDHAAVLARNGYGVLILDARGHGHSTGRAMEFGWSGDGDVRAATDHLARTADVRDGRVAVVGLSMGGEEALGATSANPAIRAVVAEGATARTARDLDWLSERYGWRGGVQEALEAVQTQVTRVLSGTAPPTPLRDALADSGTPALLIAAGSRPDEQYAAEDLRQAAGSQVTVWTVPGAAHVGALTTEPVGWESRVVGFLKDHVG